MRLVTVHTVVCPACHAEAECHAERCPRCSAPLHGGTSGSTAAVAKRSLRENVVDNPWGVLGVLFFAAGVLGLPVLWRSRAFSTPSKLLLSLLVTFYSAAMLAILGWVLWQAVLLIAPLFGSLFF